VENITRGGGRLCGGKKGELYTKSGKKSVSLGNLTILSCEIRNLLSYTRIVQDSCVVMFQVCLPFFILYEKHLKQYPCNLTASNFLTWYCKVLLTFRCGDAWQLAGNSTPVVLFSFSQLYPFRNAQKEGDIVLCCISTSEAAQGTPEIQFHILCIYSREVKTTLVTSCNCNEMLAFYMENALWRTSLVGGPLSGEKRRFFV